MQGVSVETTVGRILLYEIVPEEINFTEVNRVMKKKELGRLVDLAYRLAGNKSTVIFADKLKELLEYHNFVLTQYHGQPAVDFQQTRHDRAVVARPFPGEP